MPLPCVVNKEGNFVLKDIDFSKGLDKILKNMDMRRQEILNNQLNLRSYLVSYFKCLYLWPLTLPKFYQHPHQQLITTPEADNLLQQVDQFKAS